MLLQNTEFLTAIKEYWRWESQQQKPTDQPALGVAGDARREPHQRHRGA